MRVAILLAAGALVGSASGDGDVRARLTEARAHLDAGQFEEAKKAFEKANREAGGTCAPCLVGEASAKLRLGDLKGARKAAERATKLTVVDPAILTEAHLIVGLAHTRQARGREGELRKAEKAFRAALDVSPGDLTATYNLGVILLGLSRDDEGVAELRRFLERAPSGPVADRARAYILNPRGVQGRFAPDFSVRTLGGEEVALARFRGRVLLLDFWGTWCPPCVASVPEIRDLRRRYPEDRLAVLSISVGDEEEEWRSFVSSHGMTWLQCRDEEGRLAETFGVHSFPTYVVIDGGGVIVEELKGLRERESLTYRLRSRLDDLMASKR